MTPYRARLYQATFLVAGAYNVGFGLWACLWPLSFFDLCGMAHPRYPSIWQCLGMVVGLYGVAYAYSAFHLDRGRPFAAIGLAGKILGPLGWAAAFLQGELPLKTFSLILFNDIVWWLPFSLYLLESTRAGLRLRASAPYACAFFNALAGGGMIFLLRPGTEIVPEPAWRSAYIFAHAIAWRAGWGLWLAATLSLLAFYGWWGAGLARPGWGWAALSVAGAGLLSDLLADSIFIAWLPEQLETFAPLGAVLSGGVANGLYTTAGVLLTLGTRHLPSWLSCWTWAIWVTGYCLSAAVFLGATSGIVVLSALLGILFCPWALVMARAAP